MGPFSGFPNAFNRRGCALIGTCFAAARGTTLIWHLRTQRAPCIYLGSRVYHWDCRRKAKPVLFSLERNSAVVEGNSHTEGGQSLGRIRGSGLASSGNGFGCPPLPPAAIASPFCLQRRRLPLWATLRLCDVLMDQHSSKQTSFKHSIPLFFSFENPG